MSHVDLRSRPALVAFAATPLLLSQLPGALAFTLNPNAARDLGLSTVPVPAWVFIVVWCVIYPAMGVAAWVLWRRPGEPATDRTVPFALLVAGFLQTNLFWLSDGLHSIAIADATGVLFATTTWWTFTRCSPAAARWLLPWLCWMPITLAIKLAVLGGWLHA